MFLYIPIMDFYHGSYIFAHKRPAQNKVSIYRYSILTQTSGLSQVSCYQNMETFFSNMAMLLGQVEKNGRYL